MNFTRVGLWFQSFGYFMLFQTPGVMFGLWLAAWTDWPGFWGTIAAFVIGLAVGLTIVFFIAHNLIEEQKQEIKERGEQCEKLLKIAEQLSTQRFEGILQFLKDFYEGSPITNHVVQATKEGLKIKIGDDSKMVEVDLTNVEEEGIIPALERAKLKWMEEE